jgi:HPt (histidine-containing phosphotransfer) domain-containing protein
MEKKIFQGGTQLDSAFLEAVYEGNTDTAITVFEQYLQELPADMNELSECFESGDSEAFRRLIHKQKVRFSYVGLTDVTAQLNALEQKCASTSNIKIHQAEVETVFGRIHSATESVRDILKRLKQQQL